jgi:hypothetical protein
LNKPIPLQLLLQTLVQTGADCLQKIHFHEQNRDRDWDQTGLARVMILFMKVQFLQAVQFFLS